MKYKDKRVLKRFLEDNFDFDELKKVGLFDKNIGKNDYQKQAGRICQYFGLETVYQYGWRTIRAHISYADNEKHEFVEEFRPWHETK